jgi:hypothetical protein
LLFTLRGGLPEETLDVEKRGPIIGRPIRDEGSVLRVQDFDLRLDLGKEDRFPVADEL